MHRQTATILCLAAQLSYGQAFITTLKPGWHARLGDQLLLYAKAKALAYTFDIPYLHRPFCHSSHLRLHHQERTIAEHAPFSRIVKIRKKEQLQEALAQQHEDENVLYAIHYFTDINPFALPDDFRKEIQPLMEPHKKPPHMKIPCGTVTVAVHLRRTDCLKKPHWFGIKCHRDEEYIKLLQTLLSQLNNDTSVYIHLFTDDPKPYALAKKFKTACQKKVLKKEPSLLPQALAMKRKAMQNEARNSDMKAARTTKRLKPLSATSTTCHRLTTLSAHTAPTSQSWLNLLATIKGFSAYATWTLMILAGSNIP